MSQSSPTTFRRILAIDAATKVQAMALVEGDEVIEHRLQRARYNHSSTLIGNIDALFEAQSLKVHDVDLFAVGVGPGSFTGLRVAMAIAKALARATDKPIVGVSSLATLAHGTAILDPDAPVCAMIDARRMEVYAGLYALRDNRLATLVDDHTTAPTSLEATLRSLIETHGHVNLVGNGPQAFPDLDLWKLEGLRVLPAFTQTPSAVSTALLARHKALTAGCDDLVSLEPNYIRPSDAEMSPPPDSPA
jgi:tRNA threonylcarbamoyladenosine biosynthesis protein TsaB